MRALVLLLCIGCGTHTIPTPDGGLAGGEGGGSAGGSAGGAGGGSAGGSAGGGSASPCDALDEAHCRNAQGCVADMCILCTCTPQFNGCRAVNAAPRDCPAVGCAGPRCCHGQSDCDPNGGDCAPPGTPYGCGVCFSEPGNCTDDSPCGAAEICAPVHCSCSGATSCAAGCTSDSECLDGQECSASPHPRCVAKHCLQAAECGPGFECLSAVCVRKTCTSDGDCGGVSCVNGSCYRSLGECRLPVP